MFVYRLLGQGTMEEKIYRRQVDFCYVCFNIHPSCSRSSFQVHKNALASRVVDHESTARSYTEGELQDLLAFTPVLDVAASSLNTKNTLSALPSDALLANLLQRYEPEWVTGFARNSPFILHFMSIGSFIYTHPCYCYVGRRYCLHNPSAVASEEADLSEGEIAAAWEEYKEQQV